VGKGGGGQGRWNLGAKHGLKKSENHDGVITGPERRKRGAIGTPRGKNETVLDHWKPSGPVTLRAGEGGGGVLRERYVMEPTRRK